jgi:hypothetical protein
MTCQAFTTPSAVIQQGERVAGLDGSRLNPTTAHPNYFSKTVGACSRYENGLVGPRWHRC